MIESEVGLPNKMILSNAKDEEVINQKNLAIYNIVMGTFVFFKRRSGNRINLNSRFIPSLTNSP